MVLGKGIREHRTWTRPASEPAKRYGMFNADKNVCPIGGFPAEHGHLHASVANLVRMFGSHLSIAGGLHNAATAAETLGMDTVQIFTKNQQQWQVQTLEDDVVTSLEFHCCRL